MLGLEPGLQEFGVSGEEEVDESIRESIMSVTVVHDVRVPSLHTLVNRPVASFLSCYL